MKQKLAWFNVDVFIRNSDCSGSVHAVIVLTGFSVFDVLFLRLHAQEQVPLYNHSECHADTMPAVNSCLA